MSEVYDLILSIAGPLLGLLGLMLLAENSDINPIYSSFASIIPSSLPVLLPLSPVLVRMDQ